MENEKILNMSSQEQFKNDYIRYGIYILFKRILSDYKDGLKSVQRRVIYDMLKIHATDNTVKSAKVVGDVMGNYHPHGDSSIYGTIKTLANWFECYMPLVDPGGGFGTFQGDAPAAARYTECKLSKFAMDVILADLIECPEVVDWSSNYSDTLKEPDYLPVKLPLLLINGSFGIGLGSGMKADIPSHNITEVIDATLTLLDNPEAEIVLIPDHCMNCTIINTDFAAISKSGFGHYRIRGQMDIEEFKGKTALVIKSVPNLTYLNSITDKIEELVEKKKIIQIDNCVDKSTDDQMRYIITLKPGADPNYVREVIYKNTNLDQTFRVNFMTLDKLSPLRMSYKSYLLSFIEFRKLTKFRLYSNKLQKVQTAIHEKEAYIKVLESGEVDKIIDMIRKQKSVDDHYLTEYLVNRLKITDLQAQYIINANLKKLSMGYLNKFKEEARKYKEQKQWFLNHIMDDDVIKEDIRQELLSLRAKYGKPRNCKIIDFSDGGIPRGEMTIAIMDNNFIKKIPGAASLVNNKGTIRSLVKMDNTDNILIFDELGKVFKLPVHKIPLTDKNSIGTDIRFLVKSLTANIAAIIPESIVRAMSEKGCHNNKNYLITLTNTGLIKRMDLEDFLTVPPSGIFYAKIDKEDYIKNIIIAHSNFSVIVYSDRKATIMGINDIPYLKRNTKGSKSMSNVDHVDGLCIIDNTCTDIVVITASGRVNRINLIQGLPNTGKGKSGSNLIKLNSGDKISSIVSGNTNDRIIVKGIAGDTVLNIADLKPGSSISSGDKILNTRNNKIIYCTISRQ